MKKYFFIFLLFQLLLINFLNANTYINNEVGIIINVPDDIVIEDKHEALSNSKQINDYINKRDGKIILFIYKSEIKDDSGLQRLFPGISESGILKKYLYKEAVFFRTTKKNSPLLYAFNDSYKFFKRNNEIIGEVFFDLTELVQRYNKSLIFVNKGSIIKISLAYFDSNKTIAEKYPKFLKLSSEERYKLVKLKSKNAPIELINVNSLFDEMLKSLVIM